MNDVTLWVSNLSLKFLLVQNRSHCQPTVNALNATIRSGSLKSAGADVRSQIRDQHKPAALNGQVPTQTSLMALSHRHDGGCRGPLLELRRLSPLLCDDSRGAGRSKKS